MRDREGQTYFYLVQRTKKRIFKLMDIKAIREANNLKLKPFAELIDVSYWTLLSWESGRRQLNDPLKIKGIKSTLKEKGLKCL